MRLYVQCLTCNLCGVGWIVEFLVQAVLCTGWVMYAPSTSLKISDLNLVCNMLIIFAIIRSYSA